MPSDPQPDSSLTALFESEGGTTAIFSTKVADYTAARPDYPAALIEALLQRCPVRPGGLAVDVGAGTGLLTQSLLAAGYTVLAVEPNPEMLAACDRRLGMLPGYRSAPAAAESLPLANASADLITAAQAFHWFDAGRARTEWMRVLKPSGLAALIWNDRVFETPLNFALDDLMAAYGGARRDAVMARDARSEMTRFFGGPPAETLTWPHAHTLTETGLESLVFSRSYMPARSTPAGAEVAARVLDIFREFAVDDLVVVPYTTIAYLGRPV